MPLLLVLALTWSSQILSAQSLVFDDSDGPFTILARMVTALSPNGGENWNVSDTVFFISAASMEYVTAPSLPVGPISALKNANCNFSSGNVLVAGRSNAAWGSPINPYSGNYDILIAKLGFE